MNGPTTSLFAKALKGFLGKMKSQMPNLQPKANNDEKEEYLSQKAGKPHNMWGFLSLRQRVITYFDDKFASCHRPRLPGL